MKQKLLLIGLIAVSLTGMVAGQESIGMQAISISTDPAPLEAGDDAELDFKIRNAGSGEAKDITVRINDSYPFEVKEDRRRVFELGDVQSLSEYYISTELVVADDAPDGVNTLPVIIGNDRFQVTKELRLDVEQDTADLQLANLETSPSELTGDIDDASLTLDVVNNGETEAENVIVNLDLPTAFEPVSSFSTRSAIGNVEPGERKTASFTFDVTPSVGKGRVDIPTTVTYGEDNQEYGVEDTVGVYLAGRPDLQLVNTSSDLTAGSDGTVTLTIENAGSEEAEATRVRAVEVSDLPFEYDSASQYVGTVEPGQTGSAVFDVSVDEGAPAKDYLLDFELRGVSDETVHVNDVTVNLGVTASQQTGSSTPWTYIVVGGILVVGIAVLVYRRSKAA
jgi:LPXTG-motif cell wall-anchored protein